MGQEAVGVVEDVGAEVRDVNRGDLVDAVRILGRHLPFCHEGLHTACVHGGFFDGYGVSAAQPKQCVPYADGTLYPVPVGEDDAPMPSLLTLDVMGTATVAAVTAKVAPGHRVAAVGDGAGGAAIAAKRLGAEQIIIMGRHADRIALARQLGATDVVSERGQEAVERVLELTGGHGAHSVLECGRATRCAPRSRSRVPAVRSDASESRTTRSPPPDRRSSATSRSAAAPPRRARTSTTSCRTFPRAGSSPAVFDHIVDLDEVPEGYRAMNERRR